jgi:hypothetical protein
MDTVCCGGKAEPGVTVAVTHRGRTILQICGTAAGAARWPRMAADPIMNMRARVAQCRLLARHTTDLRAAKILLQMADEGERDIQRLEHHSTDGMSGKDTND